MARNRDKCGDKKGYKPSKPHKITFDPIATERRNTFARTATQAARYSAHTGHGGGVDRPGPEQRRDTAAAYRDGWRSYVSPIARYVPKRG